MIRDKIDSPFVDGKAILRRKASSLQFRKNDYTIAEHYYKCEETHNEFTTSETDNINLTQVYNQYRDKYGLPFPGQIKDIRKKYGISARKMSEILGLGTNSYRLYEQGEVPSVGNGRLILAAEDPTAFKRFLVASAEFIDGKEYKKLDDRIDSLIDSIQNRDYSNLAESNLFKKIVPDQYTGYRLPNLERISNMISFFSERMRTWKTKLNKLLFYSDFLSYKHFGHGISGIDYRAINLGPVPSSFDRMYELIDEGDLLHREYIEYECGHFGEYFVPLITFNDSLFEKEEIEIMSIVSEKFKNTKSEEMIEISHQEPAWKENIGEKSIISYKDFGFTLKAF